MKLLNFSLITTLGITLVLGFLPFISQTVSAEEAARIHEALPPHLAAKVDRRNGNLIPSSLEHTVSQGVISSLKIWSPENFPITVCFFGGSADLNKRIRSAALEWTRHKANIPLDFGDAQAPRQCDNRVQSDIKIGFSYSGYWSLVGQDSRDLTTPWEQSMNFGFWDITPASEPEFTQTVLHEFGHALGFQHEHQNPYSSCDFDWPLIYPHLAKPPNKWSKAKVDYNMRKLQSNNAVDATEFDPDSIMLYTFEKNFYKSKELSKCYNQPNFTLSDLDIEFAAKQYPRDLAIAANNRRNAVAAITDKLSTASVSERSKALQEIQVLSSPGLDPAMRRATIQRLQAPSL